MKLVSICVLVYNRQSYIAQCLDSIINQTYTNLEIIIVDDASNDNTPQILKNYFSKDSRIKVLTNIQNLGAARSAEIAYNNSIGYYLSSVDSDDYIAPNCVEACVNNINTAGLIYTYCKCFGDYQGLDFRAFYSYSKTKILEYMMVFHFRLFKKEYWESIKSFEVNEHCYDYELVIKLSRLCEFKLLPKVLYYWRRHDKQMTFSAELNLRRSEYKLAQQSLNNFNY